MADAQFVQENVPERIELKHQLYAEIEPPLPRVPRGVVSIRPRPSPSCMTSGWSTPTDT
ncbi:hypothetical protein [Nonomuraea jabiensis]|uniref:hypothetical protein n=1 Tax=Nonomuraea jabiensis TaxID=882448 RepID=UPI0036AC5CAA